MNYYLKLIRLKPASSGLQKALKGALVIQNCLHRKKLFIYFN
jgi:hypothetical protein